MREYRINKYLTLKLVGYNTELFVNDKSFMQCKRLILDIPREDIEQSNQLDSIDEAAEIYDYSIHDHEVFREGEDPEIENDENFSLLSPEEEFWGHCSNLQVWVEHDYDTRFLKANLAFPLLEALAKAGDQRAQIRLKEEIVERMKSGYEPVIEYLFIEGYIDMLSNEELLYGLLVPEEAEILLKLQKQLGIEFKYTLNFRISYEYVDDPRDRIPIGIVVRKIRNLPNYETMSQSEIEDAINDFYNSKRKKFRVFKSEDKKVVGLNLEYNEFIDSYEEVSKLKFLKKIKLNGPSSNINTNDLMKCLDNIKSLKTIYLNSKRLRDTFENHLPSEKKIILAR